MLLEIRASKSEETSNFCPDGRFRPPLRNEDGRLTMSPIQDERSKTPTRRGEEKVGEGKDGSTNGREILPRKSKGDSTAQEQKIENPGSRENNRALGNNHGFSRIHCLAKLRGLNITPRRTEIPDFPSSRLSKLFNGRQ
ncbi:hypothetical protein Nepgr_030758 [Nepenthes gracilis]|uniref:Uncharacterized protein n=1 Tax=Nepenthes gracilis TaxID=150966 RepID=A0AAD3TG13_NEPGR|nr:hypothetical protein Nepgr_030758 [Nepenthes gracilis]